VLKNQSVNKGIKCDYSMNNNKKSAQQPKCQIPNKTQIIKNQRNENWRFELEIYLPFLY